MRRVAERETRREKGSGLRATFSFAHNIYEDGSRHIYGAEQMIPVIVGTWYPECLP